MDNEIEFKGEWFIPDISKIKLSGTLKIKQNTQATLELICPANLITKFFNSNKISLTPQVDIICGISQFKYITLVNCRSIGLFGIFKNEILFKPAIVFIGKSFNKDSDILFKNISIDISYLDNWTNIIKTDVQESTDNSVKLEFKKPDSILVFFDKYFKLSICFDFNKNITETGDINLSSRPYLKIETEKEMHYDEFLQMLYLFQRFLVLAILEPIYPLSLKGTTKENEIVEIFYAVFHDTPEITPKPDILFSLNEISEQLISCFNKFVDKKDILEVVFDIYLGTIYTKKIYVENLFLSLVFAIEAFHRRIIGGVYQDRETYLKGIYNQLVEAIPNDIDSDFKNSLLSKLKYGYQYSMRKRLIGLIRTLPIKIKDHLIQNYNNNQFVDAVLETRNYLVHYEKATNNNELDIRKTLNLIKRLRMLLHLLLLNEIGIDIEKIAWAKILR
jgi:hypothetical protein